MNPLKNTEKADILVQALPYIQNYFGKTIVVKYGGNAMTNPELKQAVMQDIVLLSLVGIKIVLVHGGGPEITNTLAQMQIPSHFIGGLRYTDEATMRVVQMVLCGTVNKDLVALLGLAGGKAVGLCGLDGTMLQVEKQNSKEDLGLVGEIVAVKTQIIEEQLSAGYIPVIATVGANALGQAYNINADTAAARIASELGAENLIVMTDIRGLLRDKEDDSTLFSKVNISDVPALMQQGIISDGMIPKIQSCVEAIRRGVKKAFMIDGRIPHAILMELMTDEGIGTMFSNER